VDKWIRTEKNDMKKKIPVFTLCAILLALCVSTYAQQPGKIFRIGFLDAGTAAGSAILVEAFRQELRKLGWIEGKNITIDYRFAEQKFERLPELTADLFRLNIDLIVVSGTRAALAAKRTTSTIPIVMANASIPVDGGLVESLARPGGVTGLSSLGELNSKRLEILKDAVPKLARVGLLLLAGSTDLQLKELRPAAQALKLNWRRSRLKRTQKV
jgi:putative tryptophan/tyrosine transport system substrate-binding protein